LRIPPSSPHLVTRSTTLWLLLAWLALLLLPWYATAGLPNLFNTAANPNAAPALAQMLGLGRGWLAPLALFAALPFFSRSPSVLLLAATGGLFWLAAQGLLIGLNGWTFAPLNQLFGPLDSQPGLGWGGGVYALAMLGLLSQGLARRGRLQGDAFAVWTVGFIITLIVVFILYPLGHVLLSAFAATETSGALTAFWTRLGQSSIWSLDCLAGGRSCGSAWNSLLLAVLSGLSSTLLGLAFALLVVRTAMPGRRALRMLTILPIITPPFVVGLALILLLGRSGTLTQFIATLFDIPPSRWIYGLPGIWLAQTLSFTPVAFLVMIGVVQGISPALEEAAQTLRASRWMTLRTVTLPLIRPGLANAFLLCFIESLADFGNPLVIGGGYDVLSTEIFFAIVGSQYDQSRAAVLGLLLLSFTLSAFILQRYWLGRRVYTTLTGKGDSGVALELPAAVRRIIYAITLPWLVFTATIYGTILFGGLVEIWGRDHSFTLRHYIDAFEVALTEHGVLWLGGAWNSFWTTVWISAAAAPLTAGAGLLTAYILTRKRFAGRNTFEFLTMLSFATPGTVIGVSYIMAFNVPPIEMTGTAMILIISFISRNMPVGIRAGIAALHQIDRSLDEASFTLGANGPTTLRRVIFPLLRPAIVAALVYSFVSAITAVSAVIFLVSARYDWATSYIIGRVENGAYGAAIAYCSVLIVLMLAVIALIQLVIGNTKIGRRDTPADSAFRARG